MYLSSVGVGSDFDWARMDQLADAGKGASVFVPNAEEATRLFATEQFTKLVEIAADEVDIELELPAGFALGMGLDRLAMRRFAIDDIRHLYENEESFLAQF